MSGGKQAPGRTFSLPGIKCHFLLGWEQGDSSRTPKWPDTLELLWEELLHLDLYL